MMTSPKTTAATARCMQLKPPWHKALDLKCNNLLDKITINYSISLIWFGKKNEKKIKEVEKLKLKKKN